MWAPEFVEILDRLCEHPNMTVREKALRVQITIDVAYVSAAFNDNPDDSDVDYSGYGYLSNLAAPVFSFYSTQ